ncbi:MAG: tetratricopeptide repeat protein [Deltaproteobacteria bacterium]|nr:MAG: tetratricopeptide repeat protein [Deltaproteobacteria bacterium]
MNAKAVVVASLIVVAGLVGLVLFLSAGEGTTVYVPDDAARHRERGEFLLNKRRHTTDRVKKAELLSEAIKEFKKAIEIKPDFAVAHNMLGHCYIEAGNWQAALKHLDRALELRPDYPAALFNRAQLRHRLAATRRGHELIDQAIKDYRKALESDLAAAFKGDILKSLADAYRIRGEYGKAIETLRSYLKYAPHAPDAALILRRIRGLELMEKSRKNSSKNPSGQKGQEQAENRPAAPGAR